MEATADRMVRSPLDAEPIRHTPLLQLMAPRRQQWGPSRFNARVIDDDGRIVLWNTYSTAISVFDAKHRATLDKLLSRRGFEGKLSGISQYLFDRGYLIAKGTDEMQRFRLLFGQQHYRTDLLELILLASEDCNFRCTYCYEDFKRGTMLPEVREGVKNLVRKQASRLRFLNTGWFGGEPLYGIEAMRDLGPFFVQFCDEHGIRHLSDITTNGYLLTPDIADELLSWHIRTYQITLDGPPEAHDSKRKGRDGQKTFQRIHDNLRALAKRDDQFVVNIRVNYDHDNYPLLDEFLTLLRHDFAHDRRFHLRFRAVGKWGGPNDADLHTCGVDEMQNMQSRIVLLAKEKGYHISDGIQEYNRPGAFVCYAARPYSFLVGADGKLMKCSIVLDKEDYNVVGQITPEGEMVVNRDKLGLWTQPSFEDDALCQHCHMLPSCQGLACPLTRIQDGLRQCCPAKSNLRRDLVDALDKAPTNPNTRAVTVQGSAEGRTGVSVA